MPYVFVKPSISRFCAHASDGLNCLLHRYKSLRLLYWQEYKRNTHEPLCVYFCMSFWAEGGVHDRRPKSNFCGLSASEQAKARGVLPKRDMATNFGGLLVECYIYCRKPPKLQAISLRRYRSLVLLRYSLRKTSTSQTALRFASLRMTYRIFIDWLAIENGLSRTSTRTRSSNRRIFKSAGVYGS